MKTLRFVTVSGQCLPAEYREVWVSRRQRSPSMRTSSCSWRMWRRLSWRFCSGNTGIVSLIHPSRTLYIPDIVLSIMTMSEFPLEFDSLDEALESLSPLEESTLKSIILWDWEHTIHGKISQLAGIRQCTWSYFLIGKGKCKQLSNWSTLELSTVSDFCTL